MFFAVIIAYVIIAAFAICGVVGVASYIGASQHLNINYADFLAGLAVSMWPLAVATALLLLVQLACLIEKWMLNWQLAQSESLASTPSPAPQASAKPAEKAPSRAAAAKPEAAPTYFNYQEIAPVMPPILEEANEVASAPPSPPNEETPQANLTPPPPKADEGLRFFKLD